MRNGAIAALLVVVIIASAGVGYFIGVNRTPSISTMVSSSTSTESSSEPCYLSVNGPLYLIVKNDSGAPIPNQPLSIQAHLLEELVAYSTPGECHPIYSTHTWSNKTGSAGMMFLGNTDDFFNITTTYLGRTYHVNAVDGATLNAECVTLSLPSGVTNTTFSAPYGNYQC